MSRAETKRSPAWIPLVAAAAAALHVFPFIAALLLAAGILLVRDFLPDLSMTHPMTIGLALFGAMGGVIVGAVVGKWVRRRLARASLLTAVVWLCVLVASAIFLLPPFVFALY